MDGIHLVLMGSRDDVVNVQIAVTACSATNTLSLVGKKNMTGESVGRAVHSHRADAHLIATSHHTDGNLPTIRY